MLQVKNLVVTGIKDTWEPTKGLLHITIPVRELRADAIKAGLKENEDGEIFLNLNYQHQASGLRFTYRSSIAIGSEVNEDTLKEKNELLAKIAEMQAELKKFKQ